MSEHPESRKAPRIKITWPVKIHTDHGVFSGETISISTEGLSLYCDEPLALKKIFRITILTPGRKAIEVSGEVVWSELFGLDEKNNVVGFGIFFLQVSPEDRRYFIDLVKAHQS